MRGLVRRRMVLSNALVIGLVLGAPIRALADNPVGRHSLSFGGANAIWEPWAGDLGGCALVGQAIVSEVCWEFSNLVPDAAGRIEGPVYMTASLDCTGEATGTAMGRIRGSAGNAASLQLTFKASRFIDCLGQRIRGSATGKIKGTIDPLSGHLLGETRIKGCAKGLGCGQDSLGVGPTRADGGSWDLDLDVTSPDGVTLAGAATASYGAIPQQQCHYTVRGKYVSKRDESSLDLLASADCSGSSLRLTRVKAEAGRLTAGQVKYKLKGYTGTALVLAPIPVNRIDGRVYRSDTDAAIPNATVVLHDGNGATVAETAASATGHYSFGDLEPGEYGLGVALELRTPADYPCRPPNPVSFYYDDEGDLITVIFGVRDDGSRVLIAEGFMALLPVGGSAQRDLDLDCF